MSTLEETLIRTNNVLTVLEGLLAGAAAQTPVPDESVSYAMLTPTFNEALMIMRDASYSATFEAIALLLAPCF